jgi:hypothetical protein
MIVPALSGLSARCPVSTPSTLKKNDGADSVSGPAGCETNRGIVSDMTDSSSPPAAADTSCSPATAATSADPNAEYGAPRTSTMLWPARTPAHAPCS